MVEWYVGIFGIGVDEISEIGWNSDNIVCLVFIEEKCMGWVMVFCE